MLSWQKNLIYRVETIVNWYSAIWLNSAVWFCIYSAVSSKIQPFGFLFIRPSGFGHLDKFVRMKCEISCIEGWVYNMSGTQSFWDHKEVLADLRQLRKNLWIQILWIFLGCRWSDQLCRCHRIWRSDAPNPDASLSNWNIRHKNVTLLTNSNSHYSFFNVSEGKKS